jgi:hypothetical protein
MWSAPTPSGRSIFIVTDPWVTPLPEPRSYEQRLTDAVEFLKPPQGEEEQCRADVMSVLDRIPILGKTSDGATIKFRARIGWLPESEIDAWLPTYIAARGAYDLLYLWTGARPVRGHNNDWERLGKILYPHPCKTLYCQMREVYNDYNDVGST